MRNLKTNYHKKISPKQEGPFEIEEVLGPLTYRLKLPESWQIHNVFHAILLQPYIENEIHGNNYPRPPPELSQEEEVYEVEMILKHCRRGCSYQFYIKWKGYPISKATWELEAAFSLDGDMVNKYKERLNLCPYEIFTRYPKHSHQWKESCERPNPPSHYELMVYTK